jgi:hypothetical protein
MVILVTLFIDSTPPLFYVFHFQVSYGHRFGRCLAHHATTLKSHDQQIARIAAGSQPSRFGFYLRPREALQISTDKAQGLAQ